MLFFIRTIIANSFYTFPQPDSKIHIHWKGAAEIVLACCTGYIDVNGQSVEMDEEKVWANS